PRDAGACPLADAELPEVAFSQDVDRSAVSVPERGTVGLAEVRTFSARQRDGIAARGRDKETIATSLRPAGEDRHSRPIRRPAHGDAVVEAQAGSHDPCRAVFQRPDA